jgi:hypothetical protein
MSRWRQIVNGSIFVRGLVAAARLITADYAALARPSWVSTSVATRLAPGSLSPSVDRLAAVGDGSRFLGALDRAFELAPAALRASFTHEQFQRVFGSVSDRPVELVQFAGWTAVSAAVVHVGLLGAERLIAAPGGALGWFGLTLVGVVCIRKPNAVVAAWAGSRVRKR